MMTSEVRPFPTPGDSLDDDDSPSADVERGVRPRRTLVLQPQQRAVLVVLVAAVATAVAAPYPVTKVLLGAVLALFWAKLLFDFDERFVGMFVLFLPALQLVPLEALGIGGLNWQTIFLVIFVAATMSAAAPPVRSAVPGWIIYFSILVTLAALYAWLTVHPPLWPLLVIVKNWLFPFSLFFLGRRLCQADGTALVPRALRRHRQPCAGAARPAGRTDDRQSPHQPAGRPAHGPGESLRRIPGDAGAAVSVRLEDVRIWAGSRASFSSARRS